MTRESHATHGTEALEPVPGVLAAEVPYPKGGAWLDVGAGTPTDALAAAGTGLGDRADSVR